MIKKDNILIFSNYYRRSFFFEDTVKRLADHGYRIVIQYTGGENLFGKFGLEHPLINVEELSPTSFDGGMIIFKKRKLQEEVKYIVHLDCDCFLSGTEEFDSLLNEINRENFDFVCHLVGGGEKEGKRYSYKYNQIALVDDMTVPQFVNEHDIPAPDPHFENAYLIVSRSLWDKLTIEEVCHMRKFVAAAHRNKAKIGARKAKYRWGYTNWGEQWFHIGHLMEKYHALESGEFRKYQVGNEFDTFRVGYFAAQDRYYQTNYPLVIKERLDSLYSYLGGKEAVLCCWDNITKGTCMENWEAKI